MATPVQIDRETRQTPVGGIGELHLQVIVERLRREYNVEAAAGAPQVVCKQAPVRPEPVMRVEIAAPRECVDGVSFTLMGRRAQIESEEVREGTHLMHLRVPMAEMIGFATELRVRTQGRASFSMRLDHYQPLVG